jgi:hypothetical protein
VGEFYQVTIFISGNRSSVYLITTDSDNLPKGLIWHYNKDESIATLKGIPESAGEYQMVIRAYCRGTQETGQIGEKIYQFSVKPK